MVARQLLSPSVIPHIPTSAPITFRAPTERRLRRRLLTRPGLVAYKRGMTVFYDNQGRRHPATVLEIVQNEVLFHRIGSAINSVQIGAGYKKPQNCTKQMLGHFGKAQVSPKEHVFDFPVLTGSDVQKYPIGTQLFADHFQIGQFVDVISKCKGKGFQGVMARWGFSGGNASHGASLSHRSAGSTGMNTTPSRVLPGKKMAGRMGGQWHTVFNLKVLDVNREKGYLLIKGGVSGANNSVVKVRDALKKNGVHLGVMLQKGKVSPDA
ncbi:mitochondrial 54S ribosomal protein YmL9 [Martiniozyma asiatica (nom. inval.)]|nr:mitochondrial 54S ribosomal protein YmL9 [Martiniozyma asiatica]